MNDLFSFLMSQRQSSPMYGGMFPGMFSPYGGYSRGLFSQGGMQWNYPQSNNYPMQSNSYPGSLLQNNPYQMNPYQGQMQGFNPYQSYGLFQQFNQGYNPNQRGIMPINNQQPVQGRRPGQAVSINPLG